MTTKEEKKAQYLIARSDATKWELGLDDKYNEEQVLTIIGILSYMENVERGFGHCNDQKLYNSERMEDADADNNLFAEACVGFAFSKKYILLRKQMKM